MDNTVAELEAKLSTCEEIGRAFEEDAGQLRDKLAKAVELLRKHCDPMDMSDADVTTLAEIEGESHE